MAEETKQKITFKSPLIGAQAVPTTLDTTTKLDIDTNKVLVDNIIDAAINGMLDTGAIENFTTISNARDQIYQLIDTMTLDSSVAAIVRTYAENVCETADNGHIVWCESNNSDISKFVNYLLNVMNVDKNIFAWAYNLIKYGDVYLKLFRESDYKDELFDEDKINRTAASKTLLTEEFNNLDNKEPLNEAAFLSIHDASDPYSYYVEAVPDPSTMFELTKFGKTFGYIETPNADNNFTYTSSFMEANGAAQTEQQGIVGIYNYKLKSNDVNVYQADDFVHACLEENYSRFPETVDLFLTPEDYESNTHSQSYNVRRGKSLLYDSYKIWREKSLLEQAALLNRVTRSSLVRTVMVEVGDMPKPQVKNTLRRIKELVEQKTAINTNKSMSEYTNPGPIENNIYIPTHGGQGAVTIGTIGGDVDVKSLADLDYWNNKFYSSYGVPKQYFGWTDDGAGFNGGTSLTIISSEFAKGVKRVQNALIQAITDAINLILLNKGCKAYLNNFVLKMKPPVTQEEKDYRESLTNQISAISNLQSLFADIEDKSRKLGVLKVLVSGLNYGDELLALIDQEISDAEAAKKAEAEEAAANEASETGTEEPGNGEDFDLGMPEDLAQENFKPAEGTRPLAEDVDLILDEDILPTPEELDRSKDFTQNK